MTEEVIGVVEEKLKKKFGIGQDKEQDGLFSKVFSDPISMADHGDPAELEAAFASLDSKTTGIVHIPAALIQIFQDRFEPDIKTVLIAEGEKFAPFLRATVDRFPYCQYTITTQNPMYEAVLELLFKGYENVTVTGGSIYEYGFSDEKFDLIFSVPVFGGRSFVDSKQQFICREYEMVALENLLLHLSGEGELVMILPARLTFAAGNIKELRDFVQQMYRVKEISELPAGTISGPGLKTVLISVGTGKTDAVTIRKYEAGEFLSEREGGKERNVVQTNETFVFLDELEEQGDWNLDRLFASQDDEWLKYQNIRKTQLGDIADVFRGKAINRRDKSGSIAVVNITNLLEYDIDYDGLDTIDEPERKVANYVLQEGDVLIPARGTAMRAVVYEKKPYTCIASSNIIVIRPDQRQLSGVYLKMFLDSPFGNKLLASIQQGTTVMNISYRDLKIMEIPLPAIERQRELAEEYEKELRVYQTSIQEAEKRWRSVVSRLQGEM